MSTPRTSGSLRTMPLVALAIVLTLLLAACGGTTQDAQDEAGDEADAPATDEPAAPDTEGDATEAATDGGAAGGGEIPADLALAFLPKQINNPYFTIASAGASAAAEEVSAQYTETGPSEADASSQVSYINTLTQQGSDAILISANDPNAVCPALNQASEAGAAIVTFDSDTNPDCRDLFINQATAEGIAQVQLDMVVEQVGADARFAILSATPNATNQNAWIALMEQMIAEQDEYSGLEIVTTVYGNDEDQKSFQETQGLMRSYPDLDAIVAPTTVGIAAAARYISGSEYKGQVAVTGLGTPNQMREFVEDGTVTAFALWNPEDLGYLAAYAGAALAGGVIEGEPGDTFEAGELGEYEVEEDGMVVLGPPTVFNAENIDDFDF